MKIFVINARQWLTPSGWHKMSCCVEVFDAKKGLVFSEKRLTSCDKAKFLKEGEHIPATHCSLNVVTVPRMKDL